MNSGKSTLFNQLVGNERSIVSNIEGTTRDYVSESFNAGDIICNLIDTAGLRETCDEVEREGINRTRYLVKNAFYKVFLVKAAVHNLIMDEIKTSGADIVFITGLDEVSENFEIKELPGVIYAYFGFDEMEKKYHLSKPFNASHELLKPNIEKALGKSGPIEPVGKSGPIEPVGKSGPIEPVGKWSYRTGG